MQNQYLQDHNYMSEDNYQQSNSINEDLIKLRQMNEAFSKMNQQHMYSAQQYCTYSPHHSPQSHEFNARQVYSVQQSLQQKQSEDVTERSNSLLFTLSQKDEEQTRPTTNVQNLHYEYDLGGNVNFNGQMNGFNSNDRFGAYQYEYQGQSMIVNNTIQNNGFYDQQNIGRPKEMNIYQEQMYYDNSNTNRNYRQQQYSEQYSNSYNHHQQQNYPYAHQPNQQLIASNGFSKYEQFAVKISKLFNIHVQDLELIYNQLKLQKQAEYHQQTAHNHNNNQFPSSHIQISDSQVMKKLFSYALEIKNSHNKLKNMITTIDDRKINRIHYDESQHKKLRYNTTHRDRPQTHIPQKNELQNISINFMLEQQHHQFNQSHQFNQHQQPLSKPDNQTQRISHKNNHPQQSQNIQSKKTIIQKLVGQKGNLNSELVSQQTILSHSSYADSAITNTKTNKSKKKSRVTEKIKLISEQLESLKKEIDQEEQSEQTVNVNEDKQQSRDSQNNMSRFYTAKEQPNSDQHFIQNQNNQLNGPTFSFEPQTTPPHQYLPQMTRQISEYVIQVNQSQTKPLVTLNPTKPQAHKQSQPHTFGGQSFTYIKSIEQLPMDDPQIDLKIQQTIKTCIVKSPSKKLINQPTNQQIAQNIKSPFQSTVQPVTQPKKSQKLIVEHGPTSSSRSKYSFRQNSQLSSKDHNETTMITSPTKSQSRQRMFKSIAEIRKNNQSKDKLNQALQQSQWSRSKTTNNAYLDDQNNSEQKSQQSLFVKNVFENNAPINYEKISGSFAKPKFYTKQVMRDGKLVFEKTQMVQSQHKMRSSIDQRKETATFGALSPAQTDKFIKINQSHQFNQQSQINSSSGNLHSSYAPIIYHSNVSQSQAAPLSSQPVSNTLLEANQAHKKTLSMGGPSSLYSARTIQSRPFIQSDNHLPRPNIKGPVYVMHPQNNPMQKEKYEYVPKMINVKQNSQNVPANILFSQPTPMQHIQRNSVTDPRAIQIVRPLTPQRHSEVIRPVTPINKIQSISTQVINKEKPRSFSVQRVQGIQDVHNPKIGHNIQFKPNYIPQSQRIPNNSSQMIRMVVSPSKIIQNNVVSRPILMNTPVSENKIVQRPFSVPIRSMSPERNIPTNLKQTLIEKPNVVQRNYIHTNVKSGVKRQEPQVPLIVKQFDLKPKIQNKVQASALAQQKSQYQEIREIGTSHNSQATNQIIEHGRNIEASSEGNQILNQSSHRQTLMQSNQNPQRNSRHTHVPVQTKTIIHSEIPFTQLTPTHSQPQFRNPRLQQSQMYYGQLKASNRTPITEMPTNYKEMSLMSSRRTDSVVHTFPVQMQQSNKMNNSIYTKEQVRLGGNHTQRVSNGSGKPIYGEIITYQPPTSPKNPFTQQPSRIPNSFRPPKYIPPKEPAQLQQSKQMTSQRFPSNQAQNPKKLTNQYPPSLQDSSRPPIKTYTMGHLLQASKTQKYMQQSMMDDRKSNTALNASNANVRLNDLYDSTPSFGRVNQENGMQSLVISPFSKELNNLNQSRNSSASKRSSSSRSKSNRKGIALESKRNRSPSHKFYQSLYDH